MLELDLQLASDGQHPDAEPPQRRVGGHVGDGRGHLPDLALGLGRDGGVALQQLLQAHGVGIAEPDVDADAERRVDRHARLREQGAEVERGVPAERGVDHRLVRADRQVPLAVHEGRRRDRHGEQQADAEEGQAAQESAHEDSLGGSDETADRPTFSPRATATSGWCRPW